VPGVLELGYLGLFLAAFGAASLLPLQSEAVLVGLLLAESHPVAALLVVATAGNLLGSLLNWWLGRSLDRFRHRRWFPVGAAQLDRAQHWYRRYGRWSLLLSWLPVVGDPLTLVAGMLRESLWVFLLLVGLAKGLRYLALAALTLGWG
jgi:membrane protein YqaA with SNARE-associated domain